ncbi:MAG: DMT family transporter [Oscillospiraceae bacterium]|nr:DMT family transporter [Oscillospiraceae bacterium]
MKNNKFHIFLLFVCALLWGTTFVAQSIGADYVGAFTYLAGRSWIAVAFLTPVVHLMDWFFDRRGIDNRRPKNAAERRYLIIAGCISGFMLCSASAAQQIGIAYTTASKAGFITALYVVIVPILSIVIRKRPTPQIWFCVLLALVGMYLLCMTAESLHLEIGDAWELACAFLFAVEILILFYYSSRVDAVRLSRMQFLVVAILSTVLMFLTEKPTLEAFRLGLPAMLYAGIFSSGIAYTLQIFGQEDVNPTVASLVMSLESVFSAITGWLILGERLSLREFAGCALMFLAIILAQIDLRVLFRNKKPSP